jgi:hypothetical protein
VHVSLFSSFWLWNSTVKNVNLTGSRGSEFYIAPRDGTKTLTIKTKIKTLTFKTKTVNLKFLKTETKTKTVKIASRHFPSRNYVILTLVLLINR